MTQYLIDSSVKLNTNIIANFLENGKMCVAFKLI